MTRRRETRSDQLKRCESGGDRPYPDQGKRRETGTEQVRVELPSDPPRLTAQAARALLTIIRKAYAQQQELPPPGEQEHGEEH